MPRSLPPPCAVRSWDGHLDVAHLAEVDVDVRSVPLHRHHLYVPTKRPRMDAAERKPCRRPAASAPRARRTHTAPPGSTGGGLRCGAPCAKPAITGAPSPFWICKIFSAVFPCTPARPLRPAHGSRRQRAPRSEPEKAHRGGEGVSPQAVHPRARNSPPFVRDLDGRVLRPLRKHNLPRRVTPPPPRARRPRRGAARARRRRRGGAAAQRTTTGGRSPCVSCLSGSACARRMSASRPAGGVLGVPARRDATNMSFAPRASASGRGARRAAGVRGGGRRGGGGPRGRARRRRASSS